MSTHVVVIAVAVVLVIVLAHVLSGRLGVAGPLLLVVIGVGVSFIPAVSAVIIAPELILTIVLPPLLYSSAVSAPAIEFRRDFGAISGLAVLLVVASALVLGVFFAWAIPGLGFPLAVALGAILSPTDAVATSIVRRAGAPRRIVAMLEGESLLNDASALVLVRTAVAAGAAGFSLLTTVGAFVWAVVVAIAVGAAAGFVALWCRASITSPAATTALGFTVPFLASVPADALGGSGLVAAVVAGVVCGQGALRRLTPEQRVSDKLNWRTVAFVLEGVIFLGMGLELFGIVESNIASGDGLLRAVVLAAAAFALLVLVRAAYVVPSLRIHASRVRRSRRVGLALAERAGSSAHGRRAARMHADIDYFAATPLTWRHDVVVVWAGMRGAVTLAAAQTLPANTPERDLLVLVAFTVAAGSLLLQGLTLSAVVRMLRLGGEDEDLPRAQIREITKQLREVAGGSEPTWPLGPAAPPDTQQLRSLEQDLAAIGRMRTRLRELARSGRFSTVALRYALDELDAYEIGIGLRLESER